MKMRTLIPFLIALIFPFAITNAQLEGSITDKDKRKIPNAIISATDSTGNMMATVTADKRGLYQLKGLQPGKYKIEAKAEGFLTTKLENVMVTPAPKDADEHDDTRHAIRLDIILKRPGE